MIGLIFLLHFFSIFSSSTAYTITEWNSVLTSCVNSAIVNSVIVLWKLAKPTGGGEPAGISLFYIIGDFNMTDSKHFLTFSQQVESLKNEKHIEISDSQYVEKILQRIGYFSLMGGYKQLFRIPFTKNTDRGQPLMRL